MKTPPHYRKKPMRRFVVRRARPSSRRTQGQKSLGGGQSGIASQASGGGGGGDYVAKAVHFDGATNINTMSLIADATVQALSISAWIKIGSDGSYPTIFNSDPNGHFNIWVAATPGSTQRVIVQLKDDTNLICSVKSNNSVADDAWHHILACVVSTQNSFDPCGKIYVDDIDVTNTAGLSAGPFTASIGGTPAYAGTDTFGDDYTGDACDWWCAPGVSLLDGSFDIPEATRRLFISADGKPVDPIGFPSGAILFSGNASAFPANQGTGGAFTLTGTLTNASSSPSD